MSENMDPALLAGQLVVRAGKLSTEQLVESLQDREKGKLGDRLVKEGIISRDEIERIINERDSMYVTLEETVLGELAVRNGFLSRDQLADCLAEQENARKMTSTPPRLGEILVSRNLVCVQELDSLLQRQASLLQCIVGNQQNTAISDEDEPYSKHNSESKYDSNSSFEIVKSSTEVDISEKCLDTESEDSKQLQTITRSRFIDLLYPEEAEPITCASCGSSANSPLAIVCSGCGDPLRSKEGSQKLTPWIFRGGFVVLAAVTVISQLPFGPFVIATTMFIILGATMLRSYRASKRYFLISSVLLFTFVFVWMQIPPPVKEQLIERTHNLFVWDALVAGASLLMAAFAVALIAPLNFSRLWGLGGALSLLIVLLMCGWGETSYVIGHPFPLWATLMLGGMLRFPRNGGRGKLFLCPGLPFIFHRTHIAQG